IQMATEACKQYAKDGKLTFSTGCIHAAFATPDEASENACIIQITNFKQDSSDTKSGFCGKMKIIDGAFEYHPVLFDVSLSEQLEKDKIISGKIGLDNAPIVAVHSMVPGNINLVSKKIPLVVTSYDLLVGDCPAVQFEKGKLIKYSGNPQDHWGFEKAKIDPVTVDVDVKPKSSASVPTPSVAAPVISRPVPVPAPSRVVPVQSAPMASRGAPPPTKAASGGNQNYTPIHAITPYLTKWRIKGMVSNKEELRTVKMKSGESKVFNFDVCDDAGKTIKLVAFGEVAERYYGMVHENQMLSIANAGVRQANKRFNNTGHDYELSINANSEVTPLKDTPAFTIAFTLDNAVKLSDLSKKSGELVNVLGCIDRVEPVNTFTSKTGGQFTKREISLIDQTGFVVNFVLWSEQAKNFPENTEGQPLGVKGAMVKEFNGGITIGTVSGTKFALTPNVPGMVELCEWYKNERGSMGQTQSLSSGTGSEGAFIRDLRLLGTAHALQLGRGEPTYMNVKGRITNIKSDTALYKSCASEGCSKKVTEQDDQYRCEKCGITTNQFKMTYMLQMEISDMTGSIWITLFGKNAEQVMGMNAEDLAEIKNNNPSEYEAHFDQLKFATRLFRVRAKSEVYNDEERVKYSGFNVDIPDYNKLNAAFDGVLQKLRELDTN
ncbi:hypothetical protein PFISCL1PPCAC_10436, partial [Pristionchus fissidentatus]